MNEPTPTKPRRKLTNLALSAPARGALRRLKAALGMSFTRAVERGVMLLEADMGIGEPLTPAERVARGLSTGPNRNRRKGGAL